MAWGSIGCYAGLIFTVSSWRVLTPDNITGSTSSNWATHSVIGGKDKSEYTGPGLKSYQFEIQLVSKLGVNPRKIFDALMKHCEAGTIDYFILNNKPMSQNPFKLTKVTTGWLNAVGFPVLLFHNRKQLMKAWSLLIQTGNRLPDLR